MSDKPAKRAVRCPTCKRFMFNVAVTMTDPLPPARRSAGDTDTTTTRSEPTPAAAATASWKAGDSEAKALLLTLRAADTPVVIGRDVGGPEESVRVVRLAAALYGMYPKKEEYMQRVWNMLDKLEHGDEADALVPAALA